MSFERQIGGDGEEPFGGHLSFRDVRSVSEEPLPLSVSQISPPGHFNTSSWQPQGRAATTSYGSMVPLPPSPASTSNGFDVGFIAPLTPSPRRSTVVVATAAIVSSASSSSTFDNSPPSLSWANDILGNSADDLLDLPVDSSDVALPSTSSTSAASFGFESSATSVPSVSKTSAAFLQRSRALSRARSTRPTATATSVSLYTTQQPQPYAQTSPQIQLQSAPQPNVVLSKPIDMGPWQHYQQILQQRRQQHIRQNQQQQQQQQQLQEHLLVAQLQQRQGQLQPKRQRKPPQKKRSRSAKVALDQMDQAMIHAAQQRLSMYGSSSVSRVGDRVQQAELSERQNSCEAIQQQYQRPLSPLRETSRATKLGGSASYSSPSRLEAQEVTMQVQLPPQPVRLNAFTATAMRQRQLLHDTNEEQARRSSTHEAQDQLERQSPSQNSRDAAALQMRFQQQQTYSPVLQHRQAVYHHLSNSPSSHNTLSPQQQPSHAPQYCQSYQSTRLDSNKIAMALQAAQQYNQGGSPTLQYRQIHQRSNGDGRETNGAAVSRLEQLQREQFQVSLQQQKTLSGDCTTGQMRADVSTKDFRRQPTNQPIGVSDPLASATRQKQRRKPRQQQELKESVVDSGVIGDQKTRSSAQPVDGRVGNSNYSSFTSSHQTQQLIADKDVEKSSQPLQSEQKRCNRQTASSDSSVARGQNQRFHTAVGQQPCTSQRTSIPNFIVKVGSQSLPARCTQEQLLSGPSVVEVNQSRTRQQQQPADDDDALRSLTLSTPELIEPTHQQSQLDLIKNHPAFKYISEHQRAAAMRSQPRRANAAFEPLSLQQILANQTSMRTSDSAINSGTQVAQQQQAQAAQSHASLSSAAKFSQQVYATATPARDTPANMSRIQPPHLGPAQPMQSQHHQPHGQPKRQRQPRKQPQKKRSKPTNSSPDTIDLAIQLAQRVSGHPPQAQHLSSIDEQVLRAKVSDKSNHSVVMQQQQTHSMQKEPMMSSSPTAKACDTPSYCVSHAPPQEPTKQHQGAQFTPRPNDLPTNILQAQDHQQKNTGELLKGLPQASERVNQQQHGIGAVHHVQQPQEMKERAVALATKQHQHLALSSPTHHHGQRYHQLAASGCNEKESIASSLQTQLHQHEQHLEASLLYGTMSQKSSPSPSRLDRVALSQQQQERTNGSHDKSSPLTSSGHLIQSQAQIGLRVDALQTVEPQLALESRKIDQLQRTRLQPVNRNGSGAQQKRVSRQPRQPKPTVTGLTQSGGAPSRPAPAAAPFTAPKPSGVVRSQSNGSTIANGSTQPISQRNGLMNLPFPLPLAIDQGVDKLCAAAALIIEEMEMMETARVAAVAKKQSSILAPATQPTLSQTPQISQPQHQPSMTSAKVPQKPLPKQHSETKEIDYAMRQPWNQTTQADQVHHMVLQMCRGITPPPIKLPRDGTSVTETKSPPMKCSKPSLPRATPRRSSPPPPPSTVAAALVDPVPPKTYMIFCRRDFLRHQVHKLWQQTQRRKQQRKRKPTRKLQARPNPSGAVVPSKAELADQVDPLIATSPTRAMLSSKEEPQQEEPAVEHNISSGTRSLDFLVFHTPSVPVTAEPPTSVQPTTV